VCLNDLYSDQKSELTDRHFYFLCIHYMFQGIQMQQHHIYWGTCELPNFDPTDNVHYHSYNVNLEASIASEIEAVWI